MIYVALCILINGKTESYMQVRCEAPNSEFAISHIANYKPELSWWNDKTTVRILQISTIDEIRNVGTVQARRRRRRRNG